jgi:hypothetical protein
MKTTEISNHRSGPRMRVGLPVLLRFGWRDSEEEKGSIVDISERGLCVHCHGPLRLGMKVKVILEGASDNVKVYHVVWVRKAESTGQAHYIGLELKP